MITRSQKLAEDRPLRKLKVPDKIPDVSKAEIQREQTTDPSLARARELAAENDEKCDKYGAYSKFFWLDKLLYREYRSPTYQFGDACQQLVVPAKFRSYIMKLAHETILGGHQGPHKTSDKVMNDFCRSYTPFQRVAIDIVGPIHPKTEKGN